jgi:hypothetical protein
MIPVVASQRLAGGFLVQKQYLYRERQREGIQKYADYLQDGLCRYKQMMLLKVLNNARRIKPVILSPDTSQQAAAS